MGAFSKDIELKQIDPKNLEERKKWLNYYRTQYNDVYYANGKIWTNKKS